MSLVLACGIFFGAGLLANRIFSEPQLQPVFETIAAALPFFTVMSIALWCMQGFQTVRHATYIRQVVQSLANLVLIMVFYLLGAKILGAVVAYVLSMVVGSIFACTICGVCSPSCSIVQSHRNTSRELCSASPDR